MKTLYLIRGVSGSGKTTLAQELGASLPKCYEMCADYYFCESVGDFTYDDTTYNFDASELHIAHQWCREKVAMFMVCTNLCDNVVVHNTFTSEWEMKPYEDLAKKHGFKVVRMIVENTHGNPSTHNVPQEVRDNQERKLRKNIKLQ